MRAPPPTWILVHFLQELRARAIRLQACWVTLRSTLELLFTIEEDAVDVVVGIPLVLVLPRSKSSKVYYNIIQQLL